MTQSELAQRAGTYQANIARIASQAVTLTITTLAHLAQCLDITLSGLVRETEGGWVAHGVNNKPSLLPQWEAIKKRGDALKAADREWIAGVVNSALEYHCRGE